MENRTLRPYQDHCQLRKIQAPIPFHAACRSSKITPGEYIQANLAIDVINLSENIYLHCVDHDSEYSEAGLLCPRYMHEQLSVFKRIQINRHGVLRSITSDIDYKKGEFKQFRDELDICLIIVAAHAHEPNGSIESANRTIRSYFN